tara:strand:- start:36605 stop:36733 length:129 start_codon:yes stop_codon:yes gene_type:complete
MLGDELAGPIVETILQWRFRIPLPPDFILLGDYVIFKIARNH